jgi:hypothetical protein
MPPTCTPPYHLTYMPTRGLPPTCYLLTTHTPATSLPTNLLLTSSPLTGYLLAALLADLRQSPLPCCGSPRLPTRCRRPTPLTSLPPTCYPRQPRAAALLAADQAPPPSAATSLPSRTPPSKVPTRYFLADLRTADPCSPTPARRRPPRRRPTCRRPPRRPPCQPTCRPPRRPTCRLPPRRRPTCRRPTLRQPPHRPPCRPTCR